jgi:hypothetical protein
VTGRMASGNRVRAFLHFMPYSRTTFVKVIALTAVLGCVIFVVLRFLQLS